MEEEDKKPAAVQRVESNEVVQPGQEERDSLLLEDILLAKGEGNGRLAIDEVTTSAVNCAVSDATGGNMLQPHGIVPEGEEHQMKGEGTVNIGLKWNYKKNGCVLACQPQSSCRASDERIDFFPKTIKKQVVHQIVRDGTVNICVKWNYKEMGAFLPANPNHPAVRLMKELTFFQKQ